ncbi:MAG: hypothetical protein ACRD5G_08450 [Candidatus Acidiferrales bacterium]
MPKYISMHTLACLTRQGADELTKRVFAAGAAGRSAGATAHDSTRTMGRRVAVNMIEGKMLVEWEAADRDQLEAWLKSERFHYDWVMRIELESTGGPLQPS